MLGLDSQCMPDEVKKAYRRLAIKVGRFLDAIPSTSIPGLALKWNAVASR